MAKSINEVRLDVIAKDGASATLARVSEKLKAMDTQAKALGLSGPDSFFNILRGGGAAMGINMAGRMMADFAAEAVKMRDAFREGEISMGGIVEKMASGVPILGNFFQLGRSIRELITGEDAAALAEQIRQDAALKAARSVKAAQSAAVAASQSEVRRLQRETTLLGLTGTERERAAAGFTADDEIERIRTKFDKFLADAGSDIDTARRIANLKYDAIRAASEKAGAVMRNIEATEAAKRREEQGLAAGRWLGGIGASALSEMSDFVKAAMAKSIEGIGGMQRSQLVESRFLSGRSFGETPMEKTVKRQARDIADMKRAVETVRDWVRGLSVRVGVFDS